MKNHLTLIIASVLLTLCVLEKQASYKAEKNVNVENMYNFPDKNTNSDPISDPNGVAELEEKNSLYNPAPIFQLASVDSASVNGLDKTLSQNLLNFPVVSKAANY